MCADHRRRLASLAAAAACAAVLVSGCRRGGSEHPTPAPQASADVRVATAERLAIPDYTEVSGRIQPLMRAELAANVMARVASVHAAEGDRVAAGDVLIELDHSRAIAEASRAAASVRQAVASLDQSRLARAIQEAASAARLVKAEQDLAMAAGGARTEEKAQADQAVLQAQAELAKAEEQLDMMREGARVQERATADESVRQAEASLAQAEQALSAMEEGARPQERRQALAGVEQAEAQLASAAAALEEARNQRRAQAAEQLRLAQVSFETADATFRRLKALHEADVISDQRFDEARLAWEQAAASLEVTRQEASLLGDDEGSEAVVRAERAVDQARAQVIAAREQASLVEEGPRSQDVEAARQRVEQARAGARQAEEQASIVHEGPRTQELAQAEEAVAQAEAALEIARQRRDMAYAGARPEEYLQVEEAYRAAQAQTAETDIAAKQVEAAQGQLAYARAAAQAANVVVDDHVIRAPFDGVVVKRSADPGDMASPGIVLLTIEPDSMFRLHCDVPESQVGGVRIGESLPVGVDSLPDAEFSGIVSSVVPSADPVTRTFLVKVDVPAAEGLRSGLFARLSVPVGEREAVVIPKAAQWRNESLTGAWVVTETGVVSLRLARFAEVEGDLLEALSGIVEGDRVVLDPPAQLRDGAPVTASAGAPAPESE